MGRPGPRVRTVVFGDILSPWCYINAVRLDRALAVVAQRFRRLLIDVEFIPCLAGPAPPGAGTPLCDHLRGVRGAASARLLADVRRTARGDRIPYGGPPAAVDQMPALVAVEWVRRHSPELQFSFLLRLMGAHFADGLDISDGGVLARVAAGLGLAAPGLVGQTEVTADAIWAMSRAVRELEPRVNAVPFVVFVDPRARGAAGAAGAADGGGAHEAPADEAPAGDGPDAEDGPAPRPPLLWSYQGASDTRHICTHLGRALAAAGLCAAGGK